MKYPEKTTLTLDCYHKIICPLKYSKGGKSSGIDTEFRGWCKHHFKVDNTSRVETLCSSKTDRRIAIVKDVHEKMDHGACPLRKVVKSHVVSTAIVSLSNMSFDIGYRLACVRSFLHLKTLSDYVSVEYKLGH